MRVKKHLLVQVPSLEENLLSLNELDEGMYNSVRDLVTHLTRTFDDKYAKSPVETKGIIYSHNFGKGYNCGNATKYIQRYLTEGFSKSANPDDLLKALHYLLFEYDRINYTTNGKK